MTVYHLLGRCGQPIGWATKRDATAAARAAGVAWRVVRVDFGRLFGCQWVGLVGLGEACEAVTRDGRRVPVRAGFDGVRFTIQNL